MEGKNTGRNRGAMGRQQAIDGEVKWECLRKKYYMDIRNSE
jgi:hypothetical protein